MMSMTMLCCLLSWYEVKMSENVSEVMSAEVLSVVWYIYTGSYVYSQVLLSSQALSRLNLLPTIYAMPCTHVDGISL